MAWIKLVAETIFFVEASTFDAAQEIIPVRFRLCYGKIKHESYDIELNREYW